MSLDRRGGTDGTLGVLAVGKAMRLEEDLVFGNGVADADADAVRDVNCLSQTENNRWLRTAADPLVLVCAIQVSPQLALARITGFTRSVGADVCHARAIFDRVEELSVLDRLGDELAVDL